MSSVSLEKKVIFFQNSSFRLSKSHLFLSNLTISLLSTNNLQSVFDISNSSLFLENCDLIDLQQFSSLKTLFYVEFSNFTIENSSLKNLSFEKNAFLISSFDNCIEIRNFTLISVKFPVDENLVKITKGNKFVGERINVEK